MDTEDNLYITDDVNNRVIKIDRFGQSSLVDFSSVTSSLASPHSVAFDPMGNLYVMDVGGQSGTQRIIQQFTTGTNSTLSFSGTALGSTSNQIAVDNNGNLLVADYNKPSVGTPSGQLLAVNSGQSAFSFPDTQQGSTAASPQTATVTNLDNLPLIFSANPAYTANFSENTGDTNPCTSNTSLTVGITCDVSIQFTPQSSSSLSANIAVTDKTQNIARSTQRIAVSGAATPGGDVTTTAKTAASPNAAVYGQPITSPHCNQQDMKHRVT